MEDLKHYRFGLFYYNSENPRLLVPRQISAMQGYTLNFAKPVSFLLLFIILIILAAAIYFLSTISFDQDSLNIASLN